MEKNYQPQTMEPQCYARWEKSGYFSPRGEGPAYSIVIPPPNVTGSLHMGHGFQYTLMDILIRYHRMRGYRTLWQVGTDHAGIATQMVVERQLNAQGIARQDLGRDAFLEKIWAWKESSGNQITNQMRRMGISVDWAHEAFTMDETRAKAVAQVFITLYQQGLIYRGKRLVNWDPHFNTAISDLEVISQEEAGFLWHLAYPLANGQGHLTVATTRPETMLGDVAVAVHPEDTRYQALIGQMLILPLTGRQIPIIADEAVLTDFGTGCVKVTPAHDFNDYAIGQRHNLPLLNIFTSDAKLNDEVPKEFRGLSREDARQAVLAALTEQDVLTKTENYQLKVPRGDRSGVIIEPYLTDQWFVRATKLADRALQVVRNGDIRLLPEGWQKTYEQWLVNIEDWCISRQLWWGHRIPAWYDLDGQVYVGSDEQTIRTTHHLAADVVLIQDQDVLDTWFSSALWPFSALDWPADSARVQEFYPTAVLVTGFDILFFWVARMVMMGLHFMDAVPFRDVLITGLIRDSEGQKMSKTKGNVLDPIDLIDGISLDDLLQKRTTGLMQPAMAKAIEKKTRKEFPEGIPAHGTDALRFTYASLATPGRDIRFDLGRVSGYRNFCNKLWNAARFVLMQTEGQSLQFGLPSHFVDRWICSRLQKAIVEITRHIAEYRFDLMTQKLYDFIWHEYCDWYLELTKPLLANAEQSKNTNQIRGTLISVLDSILRLTHPVMPFISEEIWHHLTPFLTPDAPSLMIASYPTVDANLEDNDIEAQMSWLQQVIIAIRNIRGELNRAPSSPMALWLLKGSVADRKCLQEQQVFLSKLANLAEISFLDLPPTTPVATAIVGELELLVPLSDAEIAAEQLRLQKNIDKIQQEISKLLQKLDNPQYIAKAPANLVQQEQARLAELYTTQQKLREKALLREA